jgi:hypothetical protein
MQAQFKYPFTATAVAPATVALGSFVPGKLYRCTSVNAKAKPGADGNPRFTVGMVYMCVANSTATAESSDIPPTFLVDNGFRCVNVGRDAKMKSTFVLAD